MAERLRRRWRPWRRYGTDLRTSLWFVPALLTLAAVALALLLTELSPIIDPGSSLGRLLLLGVGAAGARAVLSAIATSMVTVAGVAFSITIVALSLAASQYSPRVLRNFMSDRTSQLVLGLLVGVFAYCLLVLRTIRGGEDGDVVPAFAMLVGVGLAMLGIGGFIYFIHHIGATIQASSITASIAAEALHAIDHLFPEDLGEDEPVPAPLSEDERPCPWQPIPAQQTGYLQQVDTDALLTLACQSNTVVRMGYGIGDFVIEGAPLLRLASPMPVDPAGIEVWNEAFTINRYRTTAQDAAFGLRQLVDIALKGLSPGINDTTTALMSIDYVTAILMRLAHRRIPSPLRYQEGVLRMIAPGPTFADFVAMAFDPIRQNAAGNVAALAHLLQAMDRLSHPIRDPQRRHALRRQAGLILDTARQSIPLAADREALESHGKRLLRDLSPRAIDPAHGAIDLPTQEH